LTHPMSRNMLIGRFLSGEPAAKGCAVLDVSCPQCGRTDQVQNAEAIQAAGVHIVNGTALHGGVGFGPGGLIPMVGTTTHTHVQTSMLSAATAPEPPHRSSGWLLCLGILLALPAIAVLTAVLTGARQTPDGKTASMLQVALNVLGDVVLAAVVFGGPALVLLVVGVSRLRRNGRIRRGAPAAYAVWRQGWYCHRCAGCYWPVSPTREIPARQLISPHEFQHTVWAAGRYA